MTLVTKTSNVTGREHTREIPADHLKLSMWMSEPRQTRDPVHVAFPELYAEDREFLMTGITPEEWEEIFGPEDDSPFMDSEEEVA